jgi:26S proteasome regulatory subunit N3
MSPSPQISRVQDDSAIVELYAWLLLVNLLAREGNFEQIFLSIEAPLQLAQQHYTRLFDSILAKLYHHLGLASERLGRLVDLRHSFMLVLRSAALAHGTESVAVVYNWILRSYILSEQHDLARKFVEKSPFPADANNAQVCRYHYYLARIAAVQTDYDAASEHLVQALRKAPHSDACLGLVQSANKLLVLVQLLLGIIPERSLFAQPKLAASLRPYLALAQAVRLGDLALFQKVISADQAGFTADRNASIVSRLHQNVLRTGLKRLNLAYSRIPLAEVAQKLGLPSVEDAEFVVLKANKDGVIEASVCHEGQYLQSMASVNSYYTREPQATLDARIATAQDVYKASVRALRFPQAASKSSNPAADFDELVPSIDALEEAYMDDDGMDF